ncbi:MAG: NADH-quinone oxidoreductase subunit NuoE [Planctomycetaceae bacterium]
MLTDEDKTAIAAETAHCPRKQGACVEALKIVQARRGWVSDDDIRDISDELQMTPDELDSVATFYNLIFRKPVGRHVILVCDSVSCWIMGCGRLQQHLCETLRIQPGQTTPDGRFTLLPIVCLGACDRAPTMMIDDELYTHVDPKKIDEVLSQFE